MEDEELEYTLLNKRDVMVYQIPPASSSSGHKADDWKQCIWRGRCRIVGKGKDLFIKMLDPGSEKLFAQCTIPGGDHEKYIERVTDSSRYFVLKITNGQRHAFIGIGFEDRNDAFDFNCSINDFKTTFVDREKEASELPKIQEATKDLALKEGEKIQISLKGISGTRKRESAGYNAGAPAGGGIGLIAPPPPSGGASRRVGETAATPAPPFLAPPPATAPTIASPQTATPAAEDPFFADFDDFQSASVAPAPAPAPAPVQQPQDSGMGSLGAQFDQLSFGAPAPVVAPPVVPAAAFTPAAGAAQPAPTKAPMQAMSAQPPTSAPSDGFDPFAGLAGGLSPGSGVAAVPSQPAAKPTQKARDPFDEFDIFK